MKAALAFIITFVVSIGVAAGAKIALSSPPHAEKLATDSTKAAGAPTDTAALAAGEGAQSDSARAVAAAGELGRSAQTLVATPASPPLSVPTGAPTTVATTVATPTPITVPSAPTIPVQQAGSPAPAPSSAPRATTDTSERRLAKVFTSMDPKQAAKVLDHMTDGDVQIILGYVGTKQAALIMSSMAPERVATLSKLQLQGKK